LMVAGVSEKIHARQSRSEASFGGLSGGRTGGGSLGGIASDSEVAGLAGDFFDMELIEEGVEGERSRLSFAGLLAFERPVIVLAPESAVRNYEALLLSLLREVYRMASRGLPRPLVVSEFRNVYQRADEIYATESVGFLDFRREWKEAGLDQLRDKIAELFSQGFGFLVVSYRAGDEGRVMKMLHRVSRELSRTGKEGLVSHSIPAHVVRVSPRIPLRIGKFWGQIVEPERGSPGGSINIRSSTAEKRYYYAVARIAGSVVSQLEVPVSPEGETLVHYALKSVAYLYLKYVLGYEAQAESGCGAEEARVDVCSEDVIVEVETLYGRGLPLRRLVELVESRKGLVGAGRELWIIIPPPQAGILPRGWLRRFKEYVKESYPGRVRVATVDVEHSIKLVAAIEKGEGGPGRMGEGVRPIVELAV
ncbi:MAG: hypothetical protein LRS43_03900, partial [Desulfurococcales archaeon]|nr:hypothetical protein [Desulfurococcales archaeon]